LGGRNQEFALASALYIGGSKRIVVASVDSDGTDGPTEVAGGIVDGCTVERAREVGVDLAAELGNHLLLCLAETGRCDLHRSSGYKRTGSTCCLYI